MLFSIQHRTHYENRQQQRTLLSEQIKVKCWKLNTSISNGNLLDLIREKFLIESQHDKKFQIFATSKFFFQFLKKRVKFHFLWVQWCWLDISHGNILLVKFFTLQFHLASWRKWIKNRFFPAIISTLTCDFILNFSNEWEKHRHFVMSGECVN